jgi:hypothetical protein
MPRKQRAEEPGAIHHVFARGNDKRDIYADDSDRRLYLGLSEVSCVSRGGVCSRTA